MHLFSAIHSEFLIRSARRGKGRGSICLMIGHTRYLAWVVNRGFCSHLGYADIHSDYAQKEDKRR